MTFVIHKNVHLNVFVKKHYHTIDEHNVEPNQYNSNKITNTTKNAQQTHNNQATKTRQKPSH